ncbi:MAG: phenylalanine--tRNA ligase subunit beta, partial [Candidatus Aenigmarchaeota archaeon]|nr:phenylalanine--tRNA ligase subunit beta [Candidatus Aenigmarchaeota archaeon]
MAFVLTNKDSQSAKMHAKGESAEISNPVSDNWNSLRSWLLPSQLDFLSKNKHAEYPQKIFEIGDCVILDDRAETQTRDIRKLAVTVSDVRVGYENISSVLHAFMKSIGCRFSLKEKLYPFLIDGRSAEIVINGKPSGFVGEIHPAILKNWGLQKAVVVFEVDTELLK